MNTLVIKDCRKTSTTRPKKYESPLAFDMGFGEALERFGQTEKKKANELATSAKKKKAEKVKDPPSQLLKTKMETANTAYITLGR